MILLASEVTSHRGVKALKRDHRMISDVNVLGRIIPDEGEL